MKFLSKLFNIRKKLETEPWADLQFSDGNLVIVDYNQAFVTKIRSSFGDLIDDNTSDDDVVKLYVDRENINREEPRLEVIHLGIEADGQLKIKLDWNKAFINHLQKNGISGETEDEAIKAYLARLTTETADTEGELFNMVSREHINEAFKDIDNIAQRELDEVASQIKKPRSRRKKLS